MSLLAKSASSNVANARIASCSSRVKPFGPAFNCTSRRVQKLVARAAEEDTLEAEAAAEEQVVAQDDFEFNYSDAKKGNQWQPTDVEAALKYYQDEKFLQGSSELPYESEFVTNPLSAYSGGPEDSSWLADVDNNEAYENDDYALAGIPEAAPQVKRNQRQEEEEANEEELRSVEDEKITAAAFDDIEGLEDDGDDKPDAAWNWRLDGGAVDEEEAQATGDGRVPEDVALLNSLSALDLSQYDGLSPEQKDIIAMVLNESIGEDLDLIGEQIEDSDELIQGLSQEEETAIAAVLSEEVDTSFLGDTRNLQQRVAAAAAAAAAAEEQEAAAPQPLPKAAVEEYIAALKAVDVSAPGLSEATVSELLGGEHGEPVAAGAPELGDTPAKPDVTAELTAEDPEFEAFLDASEGVPNEAAAGEVIGLLGEMQQLAAQVDEYNEYVFPADQDLQEYEKLVDAALDYFEVVRESGDVPAVAERVGQAPVNMYEDIDQELVGAADAFGEGDDEVYERQENFVERILELSRVTKVVKGGKLMGFRCVAVVGDGKGRVGVGCQSGREVSTAVKRALVDGKKNIVEVPLIGAGTIPHRSEAWFKAAGVVLQPASDGTGVIAGGAVRSVLELAGVQNVLAKRLGSRSCLNNARVTIKALEQLRTMDDYAAARGIPLDYMLA